MNIRDKITNAICFCIATAAFASIFRAHVLYLAHHSANHSENATQTLPVSHSQSQPIPPDSRILED